jgi:hypothetical protein
MKYEIENIEVRSTSSIMPKRRLAVSGIILLLFILHTSCFIPSIKAQPSAQPGSRQQLLEKIEQIKYARMTEALALDDQTAIKFFTIYKPAEKDIQAIVKERNEELKKLALMTSDTKADAGVDPEMQKIRDLNKQIEDRELKLDDDLKPILSPSQRARLLVFEHEFNKRIQEQVAKNQLKNGVTPEMRELRRELRKQRLRNYLLRKQAAEKAAPGHQ